MFQPGSSNFSQDLKSSILAAVDEPAVAGVLQPIESIAAKFGVAPSVVYHLIQEKRSTETSSSLSSCSSIFESPNRFQTSEKSAFHRVQPRGPLSPSPQISPFMFDSSSPSSVSSSSRGTPSTSASSPASNDDSDVKDLVRILRQTTRTQFLFDQSQISPVPSPSSSFFQDPPVDYKEIAVYQGYLYVKISPGTLEITQ